MRVTIHGRRYDTDTAEFVAKCGEGIRTSGWWVESLYRTKRSKRWFIHGKGGAHSAYARRMPSGEWRPGERIVPIDDAVASAWLLREGKTDLHKQYFG